MPLQRVALSVKPSFRGEKGGAGAGRLLLGDPCDLAHVRDEGSRCGVGGRGGRDQQGGAGRRSRAGQCSGAECPGAGALLGLGGSGHRGPRRPHRPLPTQLFFFFFLASASLLLPMLEWLVMLLRLEMLSEEFCLLIRSSGGRGQAAGGDTDGG